MELLSLSINKKKESLVNLFVVLLFCFLNPLYALSICAFLNLINPRINYRVFSIMFALSFSLFFNLRDWSSSFSIALNDPFVYVSTFQTSYGRSLSDIYYQFVLHPQGSEPIWQTYLWLSRILIGDHVGIFLFSLYFIMFLLIAYLGKLVDRKRFVVVIVCIVFGSPGFMNNAFGIWRHTFALLVFFIGIFLFEFNKRKLISRILIYSSALIHLVAIPFVLLYEVFTLCTISIARKLRSNRFQQIKLYSINVIMYAISGALIFQLISIYGTYIFAALNMSSIPSEVHPDDVQSVINRLFSRLSIFIIFYFWFNRKKISKNDMFIGITYFAFLLGFIIFSLPSTVMGRISGVLSVGTGILFSRLILTDFRLGFIILSSIMYDRFNILANFGGFNYFALLLHGEHLNPTYGLVRMILNYDTFFNY